MAVGVVAWCVMGRGTVVAVASSACVYVVADTD